MNNPQLIDWNFTDETRTVPHCFSDITLRDLFAAFALAGLLSQERFMNGKELATWAYDLAGFMLAAREQGNEAKP